MIKHTSFAVILALFCSGSLIAQSMASQDLASQNNTLVEPAARTSGGSAGQPLAGLTIAELAAFNSGKETFQEVDGVADGLGPGFNLDSCSGCHSHPAIGGTSPAINPQIAMATAEGALNRVLEFLKSDGPIREVRMKRRPDRSADGGVHNVFVVAGRGDAPPGCKVQQEDCSRQGNLSFRIPTPVFGLGLLEAISDSTLRRNLAADAQRKRELGINGRFNTSGNDGTISRFGWKAQNNSLLQFSGEAYNVEIGVTNRLFPQERDETSECSTTPSAQSVADLDTGAFSDIDLFTFFMRFLAAPVPASSTPAIERGRALFDSVGCASCHTPSLSTGKNYVAALSEKPVNAYTDLALHNMGSGLADGIAQGAAQENEFRTAPLWGVGQRLFLLHDGRTKSLNEVISLHGSQGSEAQKVVRNYDDLRRNQKEDLQAFLRSL